MGDLAHTPNDRILIVDREPAVRDLIQRVLEREGYVVRAASCAVEAEEVASRNPVDLVILDCCLPDGDGLKLVRKLLTTSPDVGALIMTGYGTPEVVLESFRAGAEGILLKPFYPDELLASVKESLEKKRQLKELRRSYWSVIHALARVANLKDHPSRNHAERVAEYAGRIGQHLGLDESALEELRIGALLHDVGKIEISESVLFNPSPLTSQEFEVVKRHPFTGVKILSSTRLPLGVLKIVLHHHERTDGDGYPFGLIGEQIPLNARIVAVADAFEVMTSDRPYASAVPLEDALEELRWNRGRQFDPMVVDALLAVLDAVPVTPTGPHKTCSVLWGEQNGR